jgi:hypothetical protein
MTSAEVQTMIGEFIDSSDQQIKDLLSVPITIRDEVHIADGENSEFDLGPRDQEKYANYDVENCLTEVVHCYHEKSCENYRYIHPYPADCDTFITEDDAIWTITSACTVSNDISVKRVGTESIKMVFSGSGYAEAELGGQLLAYAPEIRIDQFGYVAFLFRSTVDAITFTLTLTDDYTATTTQVFTLPHINQWYVVWIRLDDMTNAIDWHDNTLHKIKISANGACTAYLDMFNFNDGYCWEAPLGKLYVHEADNASENAPESGIKFFVTYRFDPYTVTVPENIKKASKCMAGQILIEHLIGLRQSITAFEAQGDSGERIPDKEALFTTRSMLRLMAKEALDSIGYGWDFDPIRG